MTNKKDFSLDNSDMSEDEIVKIILAANANFGFSYVGDSLVIEVKGKLKFFNIDESKSVKVNRELAKIYLKCKTPYYKQWGLAAKIVSGQGN